MYIEPIPLELVLPDFPAVVDEEGYVMVRRDGASVIMPLSLWLDVVDYSLDVEAEKEVYEEWQRKMKQLKESMK